MKVSAIIPAAGGGKRFKGRVPKPFFKISGKPLLVLTLERLLKSHAFEEAVVMTDPKRLSQTAAVLKRHGLKNVRVEKGGATRADSVKRGLFSLSKKTDWVLVHDAARCLITPQQIDSLINACCNDPVGGLLALKLPDTLKSEQGGRVQTTVERSDKWLAQTPQMFRIADLTRALTRAGEGVTDESSAMEALGQHPLLVEGSVQNFKVTYPQDFALAQAVLVARASPK